MKTGKAGLGADRIAIAVLGLLLLPAMTGCVGYVDRPIDHGSYVAPPVVVVQDDYVYYPRYEMYYSANRHQYAYRDRDAWVSRPVPRGVSVDVLFASPSVRMGFHDAPAGHHEATVRQYPRNWTPHGREHGPRDGQSPGRQRQRGDR